MQIVIDIPKDAYDYVMGSGYFPSNFNMIYEIRNGTVLPEHGRLIDADKFDVVVLKEKSDDFIAGVEWVLNKIDEASTVLEADM